MTREEAIEILKVLIDYEYYGYDKYLEALEMAIKALEQQPKTGQWLQCSEPWGGMQEWKCSNCQNCYDANKSYKIIPYNYCPNCGAKMTESEE